MQRPVLESFIDRFRSLFPESWTITLSDSESGSRDREGDATITIAAPDGTSSSLFVEARARVSAREAAGIDSRTPARIDTGIWDGALLFTRFASRIARDRLRNAGISYLDLTGNAWISMDRPAVFIERQGAETDPDPPRRGVQSLKGAKAARIVRGLCDWRPPLGVRELARRTNANPGYVTRVLSLLEDEDVIVRGPRGAVAEVRWQDLLRRWSVDYSVMDTNRALRCLAPRGLPHLRDRLSSFPGRYAVTGQFAVPPEAQIVPGPLLSCYVDSAEVAAKELDVRPTDAGANVILLEPFDDLVFEGVRRVEGLETVALTQCVADLLTGSGREPAQAEALLSWMDQREEVWRG